MTAEGPSKLKRDIAKLKAIPKAEYTANMMFSELVQEVLASPSKFESLEHVSPSRNEYDET